MPRVISWCLTLKALPVQGMSSTEMARIRVYSRPGCHLCEQLVEDLLPMTRGKLELDVVDIDTRPDWQDEYGSRIPVVDFAGKFICQYSLDEEAIGRILADISAS